LAELEHRCRYGFQVIDPVGQRRVRGGQIYRFIKSRQGDGRL